MIPDWLIQLDQTLTLGLNSLHTPLSDQFWMLFTEKYVWFPAYAVLFGFILYRMGWKRGLVLILTLVLAIVFVDQTSYHIKESIQRLRPCYSEQMLRGGLHWPYNRYSFFGFFSGHAANSFALVACALTGLKEDTAHRYAGFAWAGYSWAALVAISRVMMGMHYVGDITVGALYGLLAGYAFGYLARWIFVKGMR